jgi:hypothetical protein
VSRAAAIDQDSLVVQDEEPVATMLDDEVVMLSARAGAYFGLNDAGTEIWKLIEKPRRVRDVCSALTGLFEGDADKIAIDVLAFLEELRGRGLVRVVDREEPPT